jgi:hypothetical protein
MPEELLESIEIPWGQLPGEPDLQFEWFECFKNLGPERSISRAYQMWYKNNGLVIPKPGGEWNRAAKTFLWEDRAALWDRERRAESKVLEELEHAQNISARRNILKLAYNKLVQALNVLQPEAATWKEVISGVNTITDNLRIEFDDTPASKHIIETAGEGVLTKKIKTYRTVSPDDWDVAIAAKQLNGNSAGHLTEPGVLIDSTAEEKVLINE